MDSMSPKGGKPLSYDPVPSVDVDEKLASHTPSALENGHQQHQPSRNEVIMKCLKRTTLVLALAWLVLTGVVNASPSDRWQSAPCHNRHMTKQQQGGSKDSSSFSALLNSASPKSLHDLLHRHFPNQFKDGVWESERQAVEAVHQADAALATSILQLAKRETNNATATSTPTPSESSTTHTPATSTSADPTSSKSSSSQTPSPSRSSSSSSSPSTSRQPTPSTTSSPPGETSTSNTPTPSPSPSSPETTLTTSTLPGTKDDEETSTSRPARTSKPIVQTFTRTSNGNVVIITTTTYVPGDPVETAPPVEDPPRATPGLQNAAPQHHQKGSSIFAAVIGAAMALLLA